MASAPAPIDRRNVPADWVAYQSSSISDSAIRLRLPVMKDCGIVVAARYDVSELPEFVELQGGGVLCSDSSPRNQGFRFSGFQMAGSFSYMAGAQLTTARDSRGRQYIPICEFAASDASGQHVVRFLAAPGWTE